MILAEKAPRFSKRRGAFFRGFHLKNRWNPPVYRVKEVYDPAWADYNKFIYSNGICRQGGENHDTEKLQADQSADRGLRPGSSGEEGKISKILPCGAEFAEDGQTLDAAGLTLIPGLIDMHIHLFTGYRQEAERDTLPPAGFANKCLEYAQFLLDLGYTTVRDVGDYVGWPVLSLAKEIESGYLAGPTLFTSGPILCPTARNTSSVLSEPIDGADDARRMARLYLKKGAQFIKLYGSASMSSHVGEVGHPIIEMDEIQAAVRVTRDYGTYVSIHCHGSRAIDNAVRSGAHTVEHASLITEETLQYIQENHLDCGIVPILSVLHQLVRSADTNPAAARVAKLLDQIHASLKNAYRRQIPIGWGTDVHMAEYLAHPDSEFRLRKEKLDFSDEDIIKQATINSAKLMGIDDQVGSVKEGKIADLLLVSGNPAQDIAVMYQKPVHVIKKGRLIR